MEKIQWNSINKKQNELNNRKMTNHPPSPTTNLKSMIIKKSIYHTSLYIIVQNLAEFWFI